MKLETPTNMKGAPYDLETLGKAARKWLDAKVRLDGACDEVQAAKERQGAARVGLRDIETALIAEADLTTNTRSVRRVLVPRGDEADLVVVDHEGAHVLAVIVCPDTEEGEKK